MNEIATTLSNMGVGLVLAVPVENIAAVKEQLNRGNEKFYEIGQLVARPEEKKIIIK